MIRGMERTAMAPASSLASKVTLRWVVRSCLTASLVMALFEFGLHIALALTLHIILFVVAGLLVLCGRRRAERLQHLFGSGVPIFAAVLFGEAISYIAHDSYSIYYGLVFIAVLCSARLIVQEIGAPGVLRAYSQAALITLGITLTFDIRKVLAGTAVRFSGSTGVHPDLVGFLFAGFLPVIIWRAIEFQDKTRKRVAIFIAIMTFVIIFMTGSRGSLAAVTTTAVLLLTRAVVLERLLARVRVSHAVVIGFLIALPLLGFWLVQHGRGANFIAYIVDSLELNSSGRGVKSGLSGRTGIWQIAILIMRTYNRWLSGFGYRAGDRLVGTIDNGYVQLLFESGVIAGSIILGSMVRVLFVTWRAAGNARNAAWKRYYTVLWCMMIIYFLNNVSTRYLFSFGSSFSLVVLCLMVSTRSELLGVAKARATGFMPHQRGRPVPPDGRDPAPHLAWNPPASF